MFTRLTLSAALFFTAAALHAQGSNEVALDLGGTFTPARPVTGGQSITFHPAFTLGLEYDHRILHVPGGQLDAGISFAASPFDVITNSGPSTAINQYAYIFATPHLRFALHEHGRIAPWATVGVGYADYNEGAFRSGQGNIHHGTEGAAGEFGIGADYRTPVKLVLPVVFRLGLRDYLAAPPSYNAPVPPSQNNVVLTIGLVLKF